MPSPEEITGSITRLIDTLVDSVRDATRRTDENIHKIEGDLEGIRQRISELSQDMALTRQEQETIKVAMDTLSGVVARYREEANVDLDELDKDVKQLQTWVLKETGKQAAEAEQEVRAWRAKVVEILLEIAKYVGAGGAGAGLMKLISMLGN